MRKLALKIDDLAVETFHIAPESPGRGTVIGAEMNTLQPCTENYCTQVGQTCYSCVPCVSDTGNCICSPSRDDLC